MPVVDITNTLQVLGDTMYLNVTGIVPGICNLYYHFDVDFALPGLKVCTWYLSLVTINDTY